MPSKKPKKPAVLGPTTPEARSPAQVIEATRRVLTNAQRGLHDVQDGNPEDLIPGLLNVIVFGRAVTFSLQRLRSITDGFDAWYRAAMPTDDPLLKYMVDARNAIEKEASGPVPQASVTIRQYSGDFTDVLQGPPPLGAAGIFMGEPGTGGSGWIVPQDDGTELKYYARLRGSFQGQVTTHLPDPPATFLGEPVTDTTVAGMAGQYVAWLEDLVNEADRRFNR